MHTLKKLYEILDDMYYEYASGYVHFLNILDNMKQSGQGTQEVIDHMKVQMHSYSNERDELVCKKHNITGLFLEEWIAREKFDM